MTAHLLPLSFSLLVPSLVCHRVIVIVLGTSGGVAGGWRWWLAMMWQGDVTSRVLYPHPSKPIPMLTGTGLVQVWVRVQPELPMGYPCYALLPTTGPLSSDTIFGHH